MKRGLNHSGQQTSFSSVNHVVPLISPSYSRTNTARSSSWCNGWALFVVIVVCVFIVAVYMLASSSVSTLGYFTSSELRYQKSLRNSENCPHVWHGGSPDHKIKGSCWCSDVDHYCLCTPSLAIDGIIEYHPKALNASSRCEGCKIVLVKRRDPPRNYHAIPGGFVNVGESTEEATIREVKEETHLTIGLNNLEQFRWYSNPHRDPRRHTVSVVYRIVIPSLEGLKSGDDAKAVEAINLEDIPSLSLAFDHREILMDYLRKYHPLLFNSFAAR